MTVRRLMLLTGTAALALALSQGAALAHARHHHHHHYYGVPYAGEFSQESAAAVEDPYGGPTLITSRPVPDTEYNRARFGGPMSHGGRMTAPVGN